MKILIALAGLLLTGCAHTPFQEPFRTAYEIPCNKDNCGKPVVWEFSAETPTLVQATHQ